MERQAMLGSLGSWSLLAFVMLEVGCFQKVFKYVGILDSRFRETTTHRKILKLNSDISSMCHNYLT